ncbi:MAG: hypothetical protein EZS28_050098, partial [Streblomastix strix]
GENDLEVEVETQKFAVLAQHACVAAETALIFGDVREATRQILTAHNANRIIAGDAQQRREVALVADQFKNVLGKNASVYKVLGEQSKQVIRESANYFLFIQFQTHNVFVSFKELHSFELVCSFARRIKNSFFLLIVLYKNLRCSIEELCSLGLFL